MKAQVAGFDSSGETVPRHAATLSGGERPRAALAMLILIRVRSWLLVDEPTNHLDVHRSRRSKVRSGLARAAPDAQEQRKASERQQARRRHAEEKTTRATLRGVPTAAEVSAADVERIEPRLEQLRNNLADPALCVDPRECCARQN